MNKTLKIIIVFDKSFENFSLDDLILSHEGQAIALKGKIKDRINKDLQLSFKNVDLFKITLKMISLFLTVILMEHHQL
jgi:hypothetical protein